MKSKKNQLDSNLSVDKLKKTEISSTDKYLQVSFEDNHSIDSKNNIIKQKKSSKNRDITNKAKKAQKNKSEQLELETYPVEEKEKLEEIEETVKKQSTKKKKWLNLFFLFINFAVVAGILTNQILKEDGLSSISEISSKINWGIIALLVAMFAIIMILEALRFWLLTYRATKKSRFGLSYKVGALGRYYDNITPFATGEQPFQVYYLNKNGVPTAEALGIPIAKYVFTQITFTVFSLIIMIFSISMSKFANTSTALITAGGWIGFSINFALILLVSIFSISKKVGTKIITGILKLLYKMKIIKNYDKQYKKIMELVDEYQTTMKKYAKDGWVFSSIILISLSICLIYYSLPFFIHAAFFGFNWSIFPTIFIFCVMIELTAGFLPLPGGTGAAEISFTALFGVYFINGTIFWAMIIWRVLTFYAPLIQGLIILIYDYLIGDKKFQWEKKKWALEAESRNFEESHLREFESSLKNPQKKNKRRKK